MERRLESLWTYIRRAACGVLLGAFIVILAAEFGIADADLKRAAIYVSLGAIAVWIAMRLPLIRR